MSIQRHKKHLPKAGDLTDFTLHCNTISIILYMYAIPSVLLKLPESDSD